MDINFFLEYKNWVVSTPVSASFVFCFVLFKKTDGLNITRQRDLNLKAFVRLTN